MLRTNLPRGVRVLRHRRRWRQADLALRAKTSRQGITRIELGEIRRIPLETFVHVAEALGGSIDLMLRWEGEQLDRLADAGHAWLTEGVAALLSAGGWTSRTEVSFNHFGDRGRIDVLGWHSGSRALLVVEVKSAIGDLQETLGRLDTKARLAGMLATQAGWDPPETVVRMLVIGDSRRTRRIVAEHDAMFSAFPLRGRQARAWIRRPRDPVPTGMLWFVKVPDARGAGATRHRRVRSINSQG